MSAATAIFSRLRAAKADQKSGTWPRYRELLIEAATGDPDAVDVFEVETACRDLGKSEADFAADVETMRDRLRWADDLKAGADAQARMDMAEQEIAELDAAFEAARQRHLAAFPALKAAYEKASRDQLKATHASADLRRTCFHPDVKRKEQQIREQQQPVGRKILALQRELNPHLSKNVGDGFVSLAWKLATLKQEADHAKKHKEEPRAETLAAIQRAEQQISEIEAEIAELRKKSDRLSDEHAALNAERLTP